MDCSKSFGVPIVLDGGSGGRAPFVAIDAAYVDEPDEPDPDPDPRRVVDEDDPDPSRFAESFSHVRGGPEET